MLCLNLSARFRVFLIIVCFFFICETYSQNTSQTTSSMVKCGETQKMVDECFKDLPPHLMEFLQTTKIAANEQEIESKCKVFKRGMKCFDSYTNRCLTNEKLFLFKNNVAGARRFLGKFCEDQQFQEDYLKHKDCFTYIQEDWKKCTQNFQQILSEELHDIGNGNTSSKNITMKFMQFCCTRHAYENCIYNSARYKCYKHSAKFARDTAKMLSEEKHFSNCRQYEHVLCAAAGRPVFRHLRVTLMVGLMLWLLIQFASILQTISPNNQARAIDLF